MLGEPQRAPRPRGADRRQPFGKEAAAAVAIAAKPLADAQLEAHAVLRPGQISQRTLIGTVDTLRWHGAQRTGYRGLGRVDPQGDLCRGVIDLTCLEA